MSRRDAASSHTIEVFFMLTVMVVAVVSVSMLEPLAAEDPTRVIDGIVTRKASDVLNAWKEMAYDPADPCAPSSKLDELVLDGLAGDHAEWAQVADRLFGPGYDVDLVLDNDHALYPLHGSGKVVGHSAWVHWPRDDTYTLPLTAVDTSSGLERMRVEMPAFHYAHIAKPKGEAVRYGVNYTGTAGETQRHVYALTAMLGDSPEDVARKAAAALQWEGNGEKVFYVSLRPNNILRDDAASLELAVSIAPPAAGQPPTSVSEGTTLNVTIPRGWRGAMFDPASLGGWIDKSPPAPADGGVRYLVAVAGPAATSQVIDLIATAPVSPVRPYDIITARLSGGSLAQSSLVVTYPVEQADRGTPRVLAHTTPYAMQLGGSYLFGAALANGGEQIKVSGFTIEIPGGYDLERNDGDGAPLFALPGEPSHPASGWILSEDKKRVSWTAASGSEIVVPAFGAEAFYVTITLTSDAEHATSVQPQHYDGPNATLSFANGYEVTSTAWGKSPGIVSFVVQPATRAEDDPNGGSSDGYAWLAAPGAPAPERTIDTVSRGVAYVDNVTSYVLRADAGDAVNLENAVANASFEVRTRKAPVGSLVRADGDLSSLLALVDEMGVADGLTLDLYSPPSIGCDPTASWSIATTNLPTPAIGQLLIWSKDAAPAVMAATADGYLYRIDGGTGRPAWATDLDAEATALTTMEHPLEGTLLLLGTAKGEVLAVRPATGAVVWRSTLPDLPPLRGDLLRRPLETQVAYDAGRGMVIATAGDRIAGLSLGGIVGADSALPSQAADIVASPHGVHVATLLGTLLLDPENSFAEEHPIITGSPNGLLVHDDRLIVTEGAVFRTYDAATGVLRTGPTQLPREVVRTSRGDATGDGVADLLAALGDHRVSVIDGATGSLSWTTTTPKADVPVANPFANQPDPEEFSENPLDCYHLDPVATYLSAVTCGTDAGSEIAFAAHAGFVGRGKKSGASTYLYVEGHARGPGSWDSAGWVQSPEERPTSAAMGTWLSNTHAFAFGSADGRVYVYDDRGVELMTSTPHDRAGKFSFYMLVPEGGFYGSHLLVARLKWTVANDQQEARLVDWFEVVGENGERVVRSDYRIALTIDPRDT